MSIHKLKPGISKGGMDDVRPAPKSFPRKASPSKASSASPPMTAKSLKGLGGTYQRKK